MGSRFFIAGFPAFHFTPYFSCKFIMKAVKHVSRIWSLSQSEPACCECTSAPHSLQECATIGGGIPICRQAQTKLEVCLYMFLWSPDTEAVLVAMSCFRHLCEEADIRSAADEVPVQTILPNYATFSELASVSNMMGTGWCCST